MNRSESKKSKSKVAKTESSGGKKRKSSDHHHSSSSVKKEKKKSHHHHHHSSSSPPPPSSSSSSSSPLSKPSTPSKPSPSSHLLSSLSTLIPPPQLPSSSSSSSSSSRSSYSSSPSSSTISTAYNNNVQFNNFAKPKSEPIGFGSKVMTRSKVYSGTVRNATYDEIPTLEKLCLQVLMDNYTNITHLGDAPYWLIKPVLEKCSSNQLFILEDYNPRLTEDDDELWKWHCEKEFRDWKRQEDETWRDLFVRAEQERKRKLEQITRSIDLKEKARGPMRKTQLAFTDPKPPRNVKRIMDKKDKGFVKATAPPSVSSNAAGSASTITPAKKTKGALMKNALKMMQTIRRQY
ncbi:transcription elongation factor B polypeptide 3-like [Panonychus citri]|uniref:transcription elongation factor B polypeptide 3-like n=1 Tax=Panonychus citri TaxID=50023 RepID=UPI002307C441|nr:transcription elongation factor B polypeptide 3-like [Panonychus citri]XP_053213892.1 transcription elongation factor B polypeptide 3-like [Panonychus citri]